MSSSTVHVTTYHGKRQRTEQHDYISAYHAMQALSTHYARSPYSHARVNGRLCFTLDQVDKLLHTVQPTVS